MSVQPEAGQASIDLVGVGETMWTFATADLAPLAEGRYWATHPAGAESNVAAGVAALGLDAGWIGRVGADAFGRAVLDELDALGVDCSRAVVDENRPTGLMFKGAVLSERCEIDYRRDGSAGSALSAEDLDADYVASARAVHVTGITACLSEAAAGAAVRALELAEGLRSFDPNIRPQLWREDRAPVVRRLIALADVCFCGLDDAALLTGTAEPEDAARALAGLGPATVILTLGSRGALALEDGRFTRVAPRPVEIVDPVGAGDAFAAGFLAARLRGEPLEAALEQGARMGADATRTLAAVEQRASFLNPAHAGQRLGGLEGLGDHRDADAPVAVDRRQQHLVCRRVVLQRQLEEAKRPAGAAGAPAAPVRQDERLLGPRSGRLDLAARRLHEGEREHPTRLGGLTPGLDGDVVRLDRQRGSALPVAGCELQLGEQPQRHVDRRVAGRAAPLAQLLEQRPCADELVRLDTELRRRQPKRLLGELRSGRHRTARSRARRRVRKARRRLGIGTLRREGQMPRALLGIRDDGGQATVHGPPHSRRRGGGEGRDEQRVREGDQVAPELDHARLDRLLEIAVRPLPGAGGELHHRDSRAGQRSGVQERLSRGRRKLREPGLDELAQVCRHGQRLARNRLDAGPLERPGQLEREKRVAARRLVDAQEREARKREAEPAADELVEPRGAEGSDRETFDPVAERQGELVRLGVLARQSYGGQNADRLLVQAPAGEREHAGGGLVEPLDVVDGDEHRAGGREDAKAAEEGGRDRPVVRWGPARLRQQQRNLERLPLGRWQLRERRSGHLAEQISEPGEPELRLGLSRAGREHRDASQVRTLDPLPPEASLADPRLTLQEEPAGSSFETREEPVQARELRLPADEVLGCAHRSTVALASGAHKLLEPQRVPSRESVPAGPAYADSARLSAPCTGRRDIVIIATIPNVLAREEGPMSRRRSLVVILGILVVLAATAASSSLGSGTHQKAASGTVVLSGWGASPDELKLLKAVIRGFEKTYPQIKVDYQPVTGDYVPTMLAKFAARKPPDVFYIDSNVFLDWVTQGLLEPLDSYAQKSKFSSAPFFPSLLAGFQYKGKTYGYPKDWSPLAMEVNSDLAKKAGVNPAKIKTWADLTAAAKKLQPVMSGGAKPICLNPSWDRALAFVYQNNGSFLNASKTKATINSPAALAAMNFYVGLIRQGLADIPAKLSVGWCGEALGKQKAAIVFEGNWMFPFMSSTFPNVHFATQQMLMKKQHGNLGFTVSYSMAKDSQNKDAAWQLIRYLVGKPGMKTWTSKGLALPSRKDVAPVSGRTAFLQDAPAAHPWQFAPKFSQVIDTANNELSAVIEGKETVAQMLKKISDTANSTLGS